MEACSDGLLMKNDDVRRSLGSGLVEVVSRACAGHHRLHLSPDVFWNAIVTGTHICLSNPRLGLVSQVYSEEHYRSRMYSNDCEDYQATAVNTISKHAIANLDTPTTPNRTSSGIASELISCSSSFEAELLAIL
jgi:hypothetical protein